MDTGRNSSRNSKNYRRNNRNSHNNEMSYRRDRPNYSNDYDYEQNSGSARKKLIIALSIMGALVAAVGIGKVVSNSGKVQIISVQPATVAAQKQYKNCEKVSTTSYTRNHKNGTEGAIIGGVGGGAVGALVSHSVVGLAVGAAIGGVGGDLIQRSHQPDYVAHKGSENECQTANKTIQVPVGYQVQYMSHDDAISQIITRHKPAVGDNVAITELENDQVTPEQQKEIVQQSINS